MHDVAPSRRGRRRLEEGPALNRDQLVAVLLDLARREGAEAINMRRVAAAAGVSPRLLYSMVRDKAEMVDLLCEAIIAKAAPSSLEGDWRARLETIARITRVAVSRYRGVPQWMLSRAGVDPKSPQASRSAGETHRALREAGLTGDAEQEAYHAFAAYTLGHLVMTEGCDPAHPATTPERMEAGFEAGLQILLDGLARAGDVRA